MRYSSIILILLLAASAVAGDERHYPTTIPTRKSPNLSDICSELEKDFRENKMPFGATGFKCSCSDNGSCGSSYTMSRDAEKRIIEHEHVEQISALKKRVKELEENECIRAGRESLDLSSYKTTGPESTHPHRGPDTNFDQDHQAGGNNEDN